MQCALPKLRVWGSLTPPVSVMETVPLPAGGRCPGVLLMARARGHVCWVWAHPLWLHLLGAAGMAGSWARVGGGQRPPGPGVVQEGA